MFVPRGWLLMFVPFGAAYVVCLIVIAHCTLCLKNIPDVFSYNSRKHWRIFI